MNPPPRQSMVGSLTGAVASIRGALAVTSEAIIWLYAGTSVPWLHNTPVVVQGTKGCRMQRYLLCASENATAADNQQGSLLFLHR